MNCQRFFQQIGSLVLVMLALGGCVGPFAGSGTTVRGTVERDGGAASGVDVVLARMSEDEKQLKRVQTDSDGQFLFRRVEPGTYYFIVVLQLKGDVHCSTLSPGFEVNRMVGKEKDTGEDLTRVFVSNSGHPFRVGTGDGIEKNILIRCSE
jgi:hypothetical protein